MPFVKNLEGKICQALDPEVKTLLEKGWKELTSKEEIAYRKLLSRDQSLTSSVASEASRVEAGLYKALTSLSKKVKPIIKNVTSKKGTKKNATK